MSFPIRVKLTALYTAVVILSFVSFFWVSDLGFRHSIETTVEEASRTNLEVVRRLLQNESANGPSQVPAKLRELSELWANGAILEVADANRTWIFRSPRFLQAAPPLPAIHGSQVSFFTTNLENLQYRTALQRVEVGGHTLEIHAAVPTEPFDQALDHFRVIEKEVLPLLVCLAALLGYWLSGRALAPVNRIIPAVVRAHYPVHRRRFPRPAYSDRHHPHLGRNQSAAAAKRSRLSRNAAEHLAHLDRDLRAP
jgi:hypothetical protein